MFRVLEREEYVQRRLVRRCVSRLYSGREHLRWKLELDQASFAIRATQVALEHAVRVDAIREVFVAQEDHWVGKLGFPGRLWVY